MLRNFIFLLALISQSLGFSQKVTWGPEQKEPGKTQTARILTSDGKETYTVRMGLGLFKFGDYSIEKYNDKMVLNYNYPIEITISGKKAHIQEFLTIGDEIYVLSSQMDKSSGNNVLYYNRFNKSGKLDGNSIPIDKYAAKSGWNPGGFAVDKSDDNSRILVFHNLPYKRGEAERYGFKVFDEKWKLIWEDEVSLPYEDNLFNVENLTIDNDGNVFVLGRVYRERAKEKVKRKPNFDYSIIVYKQNKKEKEYKVRLPEKFISDITFKINNVGNIICSGYYSDKSTSALKGTFFMTIDASTSQILKQGHKDFPVDFLSEVIGEKKAEKGIELYEFDLTDFILRDDGGAVLVGEQYFVDAVTTTTTTANGGTTTRTNYYYYYNDIIVTNINPDGSIAWNVAIPKRQKSVNDGGYYSSYAMSIVDDRLYFLYNDNIKNIEKKNSNKVYYYYGKGKNSIVTLASIDVNGKLNRTAFFNSKEQKTVVRPKVCKQTGANELMIFGEIGKRYRFGKVSFN